MNTGVKRGNDAIGPWCCDKNDDEDQGIISHVEMGQSYEKSQALEANDWVEDLKKELERIKITEKENKVTRATQTTWSDSKHLGE